MDLNMSLIPVKIDWTTMTIKEDSSEIFFNVFSFSVNIDHLEFMSEVLKVYP